MITYDGGNYNVYFAFTLKGSVFPKSCLWAVPSAVLACMLNYFLYDDSGASDNQITMMGNFTFILGFLIVFTCQQSYSRWWEGGTLLQQMRGEWFNAYSSILAFTNSDPAKVKQVRHFQERLIRLMSMLYSCALEQVATEDCLRFPIFDPTGMSTKSLEFLMNANDKCEVTLQWIQKLVIQADTEGLLKVAPPILSRVYQQLGNGIVNLNNARKIKEFPIPFPLAQMVTVMLLIHWCTTTYFMAVNYSSPFVSAIGAFINVFVVWSIKYIASELENPFGDDPNDLPIEEMQEDYNASLAGLLRNMAMHPPEFTTELIIVDDLDDREPLETFDGLRQYLTFACTENGRMSIDKRMRNSSESTTGQPVSSPLLLSLPAQPTPSTIPDQQIAPKPGIPPDLTKPAIPPESSKQDSSAVRPGAPSPSPATEVASRPNTSLEQNANEDSGACKATKDGGGPREVAKPPSPTTSVPEGQGAQAPGAQRAAAQGAPASVLPSSVGT